MPTMEPVPALNPISWKAYPKWSDFKGLLAFGDVAADPVVPPRTAGIGYAGPAYGEMR